MDYWWTGLLGVATVSVEPPPIEGQTGVWIKSASITLSSAMIMTGATVNSATTQVIYDSGIAQECTVNVGAIQYISNGGIATSCQFGGYQYVSTGGLASDCVFSGGGRQYCLDGGIVSGGSIDSSSFVVAYAGGTVNGVTVSAANASAVISSGAIGNNLSLGAGVINAYGGLNSMTATAGIVNMYYPTVVSSPTIAGTASAYIRNSGVVVYDPFVSGTGKLFGYSGSIISGGTAVGNNSPSGVIVYVYNGGSTVDITVTAVAQLRVSSGAFAEHPIASSAGQIIVYTGGSTNNFSAIAGSADISAGAYATTGYVNSGLCRVWGIAQSVTVDSGGIQYVYSGGSAFDITLLDGTVTVFAGGVASGAVISGGIATFNTALEGLVTFGGSTYCTPGIGNVVPNPVLSGGVFIVYNGIVSAPTIVKANTEMLSTTVVNDAAVIGNGYLQLRFGASASGVTVSATGRAFISAGCTATNLVISSGGSLYVYSGGTALAVTSNAGALITVLAGGYIEYVTS